MIRRDGEEKEDVKKSGEKAEKRNRESQTSN